MTQTNFIFQTITGPVLKVHKVKSAKSVVPKVCSADPLGSVDTFLSSLLWIYLFFI